MCAVLVLADGFDLLCVVSMLVVKGMGVIAVSDILLGCASFFSFWESYL